MRTKPHVAVLAGSYDEFQNAEGLPEEALLIYVGLPSHAAGRRFDDVVELPGFRSHRDLKEQKAMRKLVEKNLAPEGAADAR